MINYSETLALFEKFNVDSGLRALCVEKCQGKCCNTCFHHNPNACHKQEGRRLACSIFYCMDVTALFEKKDEIFFNRVRDLIYHRIRKFQKPGQSLFFDRPSDIFFNNFSLSDDEESLVRTFLAEFDYRQLKSNINYILSQQNRAWD